MHAETISEITAHFIGYFDKLVEEARLRHQVAEGDAHEAVPTGVDEEPSPQGEFASALTVPDYNPQLSPIYAPYALQEPAHWSTLDSWALPHLTLPAPHIAHGDHFHVPYLADAAGYAHDYDHMLFYPAAATAIGHISQLNIIWDDDVFDQTGAATNLRSTAYVLDELTEYKSQADSYSPIADFPRTDSPEGLQSMALAVRPSAEAFEASGGPPLPGGANGGVQTIMVSDSIAGTFVNGQAAQSAPLIDDYMPMAGQEEPDDEEVTQVSLSGGDPQVVDVIAGANVLSNIAGSVETGVVSHVTAVMGSYYQIDAISQTYVYGDQDMIDGAAAAASGTTALNIATFAMSAFDAGGPEEAADADGVPVFPTYWQVSYMQGDIVFENWTEQYNFISDNDTISLTANGTSLNFISGENTAFNLGTFVDLGSQYDLVIIGGNVYDMNIINQMAVLYDNDTVNGFGDPSTSGNLIWNEALIQNFGLSDRFEVMPDYVNDAVYNIENGIDVAPSAMLQDSNFEGIEGLKVLYVTGDFYQINYFKQTNILGDSDDVEVLGQSLTSEGASISVSTGDNALVNVAAITDFDSFGDVTYVGGGVYSDAVLIQSGLVENDTPDTTQSQQLVTEVIAFLDDDTGAGNGNSAFGHSQGAEHGSGHASSHASAHADEAQSSDVMGSILV